MAPTAVDSILDTAHVVVGDGQVLDEASVAVQDGRIAGVGSKAAIHEEYEARVVHDFSRHLLMPGLVNAHTHLAMTLLRGYAEGVDLQGFLERVWAAEGAIMDPPTVALGTELGAVESLLGGVTTAADMYFHPSQAHEAAVGVGLRHVSGPIFLDESPIDGLTWEQRLDAARAWPGELARIGGPFVPAALMPHGTYTVSPEHLSDIAAVATEIDALVHIHASETLAENADVMSRFGASPVGVLERSGVLERQTLLAHGIHLSDDDVAIIAARGAAVAHCPVSGMKLGSGMADTARLAAAGVTVGLGTDGCSSSNDLDPWVVMRTAALVATQVTGSPAAVHPRDIVIAATAGGAAAVGMGDRIGMVREGMEADLIAVHLDQPHLTPVHDIHALLVFATRREDVTDVFVAGRRVVADRVVTTVDLHELMARAHEAARRAP